LIAEKGVSEPLRAFVCFLLGVALQNHQRAALLFQADMEFLRKA